MNLLNEMCLLGFYCGIFQTKRFYKTVILTLFSDLITAISHLEKILPTFKKKNVYHLDKLSMKMYH